MIARYILCYGILFLTFFIDVEAIKWIKTFDYCELTIGFLRFLECGVLTVFFIVGLKLLGHKTFWALFFFPFVILAESSRLYPTIEFFNSDLVIFHLLGIWNAFAIFQIVELFYALHTEQKT